MGLFEFVCGEWIFCRRHFYLQLINADTFLNEKVKYNYLINFLRPYIYKNL